MACPAARRKSGTKEAGEVMVGQAGGTTAVYVAATAARQLAGPAVQSAAVDALSGSATSQSAAARVGEQPEAVAEAVAEIGIGLRIVAAVGSDGLALHYLAETVPAPAAGFVAAGTGSSSVVVGVAVPSLGLDRLVHAAERSRARGLARLVG